MPRLRLFLFASLSANVLLGVLGWQRYAAGGNEEATPEEAVAEASVSPDDWNALVDDATDEDFVARLRREGFPARVIRKLVTLRVEDRYAQRLQLLRVDTRQVPYWLDSLPVDQQERERRAAIRALEREMKKEIRRLLGTGAFHLPGDYSYDHREWLFGDLPDERVAEIEAINTDYIELEEEVRQSAQRFKFPDDLEKLKLFERERRADLARLLTPSELEHYDRRSSWSAYAVRNALVYFEVTEPEYLAMYEAQRAFDERHGMQYLSREEEERRLAARPELLAAWELALGPVRFEEFQLATDERFGDLYWWVEMNGLPPERALDLMRVVRGFDGPKRALNEDKSLTADQRAARLETLMDQARGDVAGIVGEPMLGAFLDQAGELLSTPPPQLPAAKH